MKVKADDHGCLEVAKSSKKSKSKMHYPYGTTITLGEELIKKFPELKKLEAGAELGITGKVKIKMVRVVDCDEEHEYGDKSQIELQITGLEFDQNDSLSDAFNED